MGPVKVVLGALIVEAMDLREVVRFEAGDQVVEKLQQIDGRPIGQGRRRDADGASAMWHVVLLPSTLERSATRAGSHGLREDIQI